MTADDVAFSLNRLLDPKLASYRAGFVAHVKQAVATDRYTMTVDLTEPDTLWQYPPLQIPARFALKLS